MRRRLRAIRKENSILDSIREIRGKIEYILWLIRNTNAPSVVESSSSSFSVPTVETLPAIPTGYEEYQAVFWTSVGAGTGDDQVWEAYVGQGRWYPCQKPTTLSGVP